MRFALLTLTGASSVVLVSAAVPVPQRTLGGQPRAHVRPGTAPAYAARLRRLVPGLLIRYRVPGAVVAVVDAGRAPWVAGFGTLAARPDARLEAGSLTKPVFAYGVLRLVHAGRLALDTPLVAYLPWDSLAPSLAADPRAARVTTRMALAHTTGLPNWRRGAPLALTFPPGSRWSYSGEGYGLLQRVVEHLTAEPLERYLGEAVFAPLGMTASTVVGASPSAPPGTSPAASAASAVGGYDRAGRPLPPERYTRAVAASSLRTTARDYARFLAAVLAPAVVPGAPLPADALTTWRMPQVPVDTALGLAWGLGWALALPPKTAGRPGPAAGPATVVFHWGSNPGFKSFALVDYDARRALVLLTDGDAGLEVAEPITAAVLPGVRPWFRFHLLHPDD